MTDERRDIRVRQATLEDVDQIAPMFDAYRQFYGQAPDADLARGFLADRLRQKESIVFLASDEEGNALGFTQLYPSFSSAAARRIFVLNDLFVRPEARRSGVARVLLDAAADYGRRQGAARLTLSTALDNRAAQALYEALEWRRDHVFCTYSLPLE